MFSMSFTLYIGVLPKNGALTHDSFESMRSPILFSKPTNLQHIIWSTALATNSFTLMAIKVS